MCCFNNNKDSYYNWKNYGCFYVQRCQCPCCNKPCQNYNNYYNNQQQQCPEQKPCNWQNNNCFPQKPNNCCPKIRCIKFEGIIKFC